MGDDGTSDTGAAGAQRAGEPEWFERLLELAIEVNATIWSQLEGEGVTADTPLRLAFVYVAPGEDQAHDLSDFIAQETDYEVRAHSQRDDPQADEDWFVAGVTQPAPLTRELADAWVEWMVAAGVAHGPCAFDGWSPVLGEQEPPAA